MTDDAHDVGNGTGDDSVCPVVSERVCCSDCVCYLMSV